MKIAGGETVVGCRRGRHRARAEWCWHAGMPSRDGVLHWLGTRGYAAEDARSGARVLGAVAL